MPRTHDHEDPIKTAGVRLADVAVEWFGDEAVALVIARERFVTLDRSGGEILDTALAALGGRALTPADVAAFLVGRYALTGDEAAAASERLVGDWLGCGILETA
jgi:hypothetical protein